MDGWFNRGGHNQEEMLAPSQPARDMTLLSWLQNPQAPFNGEKSRWPSYGKRNLMVYM